MEVSIYKIAMRREDFIEYLIERGMGRIGDQIPYSSEIAISESKIMSQVNVDFFFKLEPEDVAEIEWYNYWKNFFNENSRKTKSIESVYGMIVIEIEECLYAISLGRGHSYANSIADMDFGFDIAEIIHDDESIEIKSAKYFNRSKNRSLTQYNVNSFVTTEIGESHELFSKIKLKAIYSEFLLFNYDEKMKFGSAVRIDVKSYSPSEIINIVYELHYLLFNEEKSGNLPRMNFLKNNEDNQPIISDLNARLLKAVLSSDESVTLSYYIEDDGDIFIEPARDDVTEIVFGKGHPIDSYTIDSISRKLNEINCDDITKVSIRPISNKQRQYKLMRILDYNTVYDGKNYCLFNGKWASFNDSYINYIEREIRRVNEITVYYEIFSLTDENIHKGRELQSLDPEKYDQVEYDEYPYNIYLEHNHNYKLLDRKRAQHIFKTVEFADLYNESDHELIHVKIGTTPDFRYCIQQSLHSAEILNIHHDVLDEYDISKIERITMLFVTKLSRIIDEDTKSIDFSKINSIYFKIEVIEWLTKLRSLNFDPVIIVSKDLRAN